MHPYIHWESIFQCHCCEEHLNADEEILISSLINKAKVRSLSQRYYIHNTHILMNIECSKTVNQAS